MNTENTKILLGSQLFYYIQVDNDNCFTFLNDCFKKIIFYSSRDGVGQNILQLIHHEDCIKYYEIRKKCFNDLNTTFLVALRMIDNQRNDFFMVKWEFKAVKNDNNQYFLEAIGWDDTQNMNFIKQRSAQINKVLEILPDVLLVIDKDLTILNVFRNAKLFFEYSPLNLIGKKIDNLPLNKSERELFKQNIHKTFEDKSVQDVEYFWEDVERRKRHFLANGVAVDFLNKNCVLWLAKDITEFKNTQELLVKRNEQLTDIANLNAHKVRGPVATILGLIQLFEPQNMDKQNRELFEMLHLTVQKLDLAIHQIIYTTYEDSEKNDEDEYN